jgi:hypothetical protein
MMERKRKLQNGPEGELESGGVDQDQQKPDEIDQLFAGVEDGGKQSKKRK